MTIKAEDRERYTRELMRCLDQIEELDEERRSQAAAHRAALEALKQSVSHWRNLLAGRKGEQLELPESAKKKGALQ